MVTYYVVTVSKKRFGCILDVSSEALLTSECMSRIVITELAVDTAAARAGGSCNGQVRQAS